MVIPITVSVFMSSVVVVNVVAPSEDAFGLGSEQYKNEVPIKLCDQQKPYAEKRPTL